MKRLITFLLLFAAIKVAGQTTGYLRFDTVMIYKVGGTAELVLMNKTKDSLGILTNYGNGRTRFIKSRAINDSTIVIGLDTLVIRGANSGGVGNNTNLGSGYRWLVPASQGIKTAATGYGVLIDSTSTANSLRFRADTTGSNGLVTRTEFLDSTDITTVVVSPLEVAQGATWSTPDSIRLKYSYGLDTTSTGRLKVDSFSIASRARVQKGIDSVAALLSSATITDTAVSKAYKFRPSPNANNYNNDFIVDASGVFRFDVSAGIGNPTTAAFIESGGHKKQYFDSVTVVASSNTFKIWYPKVKEILHVQAKEDETGSGYPVDQGPSVALDQAIFSVYRSVIWSGDLVGGAGASGFTPGGGLGGISADWASSPGLYRFSMPSSITGKDAGKLMITYSGDSTGRTIKRKVSGLSSFEFGFFLCDDVGNPITINPGAGDRVTISSNIPYKTAYLLSPVNADNTIVLSSLLNYWVEAKFEVYMIVTQLHSTANAIKWQAYPSATAYKIYRDVNADFSTQTLIYNGTGFNTVDYGLTTNTQYHYKMVAVVGGVDTEVTKGWKCRTL